MYPATLRPSATDLARRLRALNNAQRGSFGEFLFGRVARETLRAQVDATRRARADFVVDGVRIDVKTTVRDLDRAPPRREPRAPRVAGRPHPAARQPGRGGGRWGSRGPAGGESSRCRSGDGTHHGPGARPGSPVSGEQGSRQLRRLGPPPTPPSRTPRTGAEP